MRTTDIIGHFIAENFEKRRIVALPLQQIVYEGPPCDLGGAILTRNASAFLERVRLVSTPEQHWGFVDKGYAGDWHKTAATGVTLSEIESQPFLLIAKQLDWERMAVVPDHDYQIFELNDAQEIGEQQIDILRFDLCDLRRFGLPGTAGMLDNRSNFSAAICYSNDSDHEAHLIAGQTDAQMLIKGLGLEVPSDYQATQFGNGEVGNILRHALTWFRRALNTSSKTERFIDMMIILEFLADPKNYTKSKEVSQTVALHNARSPNEYKGVRENFDQFSGKGKDYPGLRTRIVHTGKRLEDLVSDPAITEKHFTRLEEWMRKMLHDMIPMANHNWEKVETYRAHRKAELKV